MIRTAKSPFLSHSRCQQGWLVLCRYQWLIIHRAQLHPHIPSCKDCFGDFKGWMEPQSIWRSFLVVSPAECSLHLHNILLDVKYLCSQCGPGPRNLFRKSDQHRDNFRPNWILKKILFGLFPSLWSTYIGYLLLELSEPLYNNSNKPHSTCFNEISTFSTSYCHSLEQLQPLLPEKFCFI